MDQPTKDITNESGNLEVNPIIMKRVYQSIIEQLICLIQEGKLNTGQKLPPERSLAEKFNVSRASIREAFRAMEIIGLLEIRPGGGTYITDLNIANFINTISPLFVRTTSMENELLEFRKLLEVEAVRLASVKRKDEDLKQIEGAISLMELTIESNDINLGEEMDIKFHKTIFLLTGNYILIKAAECVAYILESSVRFNRKKILINNENSKVLLEQHKMIYEAIRNRNGKLAVEIMEKHLCFVQSL